MKRQVLKFVDDHGLEIIAVSLTAAAVVFGLAMYVATH